MGQVIDLRQPQGRFGADVQALKGVLDDIQGIQQRNREMRVLGQVLTGLRSGQDMSQILSGLQGPETGGFLSRLLSPTAESQYPGSIEQQILSGLIKDRLDPLGKKAKEAQIAREEALTKATERVDYAGQIQKWQDVIWRASQDTVEKDSSGKVVKTETVIRPGMEPLAENARRQIERLQQQQQEQQGLSQSGLRVDPQLGWGGGVGPAASQAPPVAAPNVSQGQVPPPPSQAPPVAAPNVSQGQVPPPPSLISIWGKLSEEDKESAMGALRKGVSPSAIIKKFGESTR